MTDQASSECSFSIEESTAEVVKIALFGHLTAKTTATVWQPCIDLQQQYNPQSLVVDASDVDYCDGAGIGLLVAMRNNQIQQQHEFTLFGLKPQLERLFNMISLLPEEPKAQLVPPVDVITETGKFSFDAWNYTKESLTFAGEFCYQIGQTILHPKQMRWRDLAFLLENVGPNAFLIVAVVGFFLGMVMAFQASIQMKQFGATIYVANLVGIALTRELGPLMSAIILTGRSASSFAAEIGTMKINQEVDSLRTMGLEPLPFLAMPRLLAAVLMAPVLNIFMILFGLLGGALVMKTLGYSLPIYLSQLESAITVSDIIGGMFKTIVFGLIIAMIGCMHGLRTQRGAQAVGLSTTAAVVSGIILIIIVDGVFSIVYYALGI